jgi:hypothetical protein
VEDVEKNVLLEEFKKQTKIDLKFKILRVLDQGLDDSRNLFQLKYKKMLKSTQITFEIDPELDVKLFGAEAKKKYISDFHKQSKHSAKEKAQIEEAANQSWKRTQTSTIKILLQALICKKIAYPKKLTQVSLFRQLNSVPEISNFLSSTEKLQENFLLPIKGTENEHSSNFIVEQMPVFSSAIVVDHFIDDSSSYGELNPITGLPNITRYHPHFL